MPPPAQTCTSGVKMERKKADRADFAEMTATHPTPLTCDKVHRNTKNITMPVKKKERGKPGKNEGKESDLTMTSTALKLWAHQSHPR